MIGILDVVNGPFGPGATERSAGAAHQRSASAGGAGKVFHVL
jgi:hypothetical protein